MTLHVTGVALPALDLVGSAAQGVLKVRDFTATDDHGAPVGFSAGMDTVDSRGNRVVVPRFTLGAMGPYGATVRYRITLGAREGDSHVGFTGRTFGYNGRGFGFATGRQVFLIPDQTVPVRTITVRFQAPSGGRVVTPWRRDRDHWDPSVPGVDPRDPLVAAAIAWGRLHERVVPMGRTRLRLVYGEDAEARPSDHDIDVLQRCARFVRDLFGRDLGREYLVILAGTTPELDEIAGEGWGTGQGGTLLPIGGRTMRTFARRLIEAYVLYPPYRATLHDPKQYWLIDATREWYAWRAVEAAGLLDGAQIDGDLAQAYFEVFNARGVDRNLEVLYRKDSPSPIVQQNVAPLVLRYLDWQLRNVSSFTRGMDPLIPKLFEPRGQADLWDLLPGGSPRWASFRHDFVQGFGTVPVSQLDPVSPARPQPIGYRGATHKTIMLLYTGNSHGFLETCGCKVNQSGGVARRATVLARARARDPEAIVLDAGNFCAQQSRRQGPDPFSRLEQRFFLQMMDQARYEAASLGSAELALGYRTLRSQLRGLRTPFLGANIEVRSPEAPTPFVLLHSHGLRIGVVGVMEPPQGQEATAALDWALRDVVVLDPVATAARVVSSLQNRVDLVIVMGEIRPITIRRLIRTCPRVDVVISTRCDVPVGIWDAHAKRLTLEREEKSGFVGGTLVLYTNLDQYGVHQVQIALGDDSKIVGADVKDVWLREDIPDDSEVQLALSRFYESAARLAGSESGVRGPLAANDWKTGPLYVGAGRCAGCHAAEYRQWRSTPHASAFKTLLERHRQVQPRCVSCHVVGYGEPTGFRLGDKEEPLGNVQCEVCHGPGGEHVDHPSTANITRAVPEHVCVSCHNEEHSNAFAFAERIRDVMHGPASGGFPTASAR